MRDCKVKKAIDKAIKTMDENTLIIIYFLLKKMEYTQKKKFNSKEYVEYIENRTGLKLPRGYDPFKEK